MEKETKDERRIFKKIQEGINEQNLEEMEEEEERVLKKRREV